MIVLNFYHIRRLFGSLAAIGATLILIGCFSETDVQGSVIAEQRPEDIPSLELYEATVTLVRSDDRLFMIKANRAESFPGMEIQRFQGIEFEERDNNGDVLSYGSADALVHYFDKDDVEMMGAVEFYSTEQSTLIKADYLFWEDETQILRSNESDIVEVLRDSGSYVRGTGLHADMRNQVVELASEISGVIVTTDDSTTADQEDDEDTIFSGAK